MEIDKMPDGYKFYTKKPIPIKAVQINETFTVETLEGTHTGNAGDYLIEGIEGELYPCKKEIFLKTYEEVVENDNKKGGKLQKGGTMEGNIPFYDFRIGDKVLYHPLLGGKDEEMYIVEIFGENEYGQWEYGLSYMKEWGGTKLRVDESEIDPLPKGRQSAKKSRYDKFAYYKDRVKMVKLINNEGEIIEKEGYSVEGSGIFDLEGEEYIAGYTEDGEMHASNVDVDDTVLNLDWERTQYKLSAIGGDTLKKLVTQCLNDWDLPSMKTFEDLVENGIVKEINEFTFEVGGEKIKAMGEGSGMYSREWSFELGQNTV